MIDVKEYQGFLRSILMFFLQTFSENFFSHIDRKVLPDFNHCV